VTPSPPPRRPKAAAAPDAVGLLYDTTLCIGCKACVVACREANDRRRTRALVRTGCGTPHRPERPHEERHQALQAKATSARSQGAVHALHRPGLRRRLHAGRPAEDATTASSPTTDALRRLPLLPDRLPLQRAEVRVEASATPKIVKCELCATGSREGKEPGCTEVCPRDAVIYGKRRPAEGGAPALDENPDRYVPKVYGETDAGGTQVLYLSHVPFEKLGLPDSSATRCPPRLSEPSSTASTRASSRRSRSTACSPA
jgi:Fe-S-cluster-containing dehydrogenase component